MTTPYIEQDCTVTFEGRAFTSGGAVVTDTHLVAYPCQNGVLADWHGKRIGTWRELSSRPAIFFGYRSWIGNRYYYMRASVNGRAYSLRGFGVGMIAMGKAVKS